jgi:protein TonB
VLNGLLVHRVQPKYPPIAVQLRLEGAVLLRAVIGRDGRVKELEILSGHPLLIEAALKAIWQWRYQPTLLNGEPVEVESLITVKFALNR